MRELLEEYALGLLTPEQQQQVAAHLAGCPDCRAIAQEYADQLATLPEALAAVSPHQLPTALKARLLQRLETGATNGLDNSLLRPLLPDSTPIKPTLPPAVARPAPDLHLGIRRLRWALAVATILLVFTLAWSIRLNVALARERALRTEFIELVGHQHELVLEIVDSGKTTRRVLRSTSESSNAYGKVFTRSDMAYVVAMAARLPQPPPGQAYHLWLVRGDQTELAGMMKINQEGFALVIYEADQHDPVYDRAYVTLQPQGSTTPEGAPSSPGKPKNTPATSWRLTVDRSFKAGSTNLPNFQGSKATAAQHWIVDPKSMRHLPYLSNHCKWRLIPCPTLITRLMIPSAFVG